MKRSHLVAIIVIKWPEIFSLFNHRETLTKTRTGFPTCCSQLPLKKLKRETLKQERKQLIKVIYLPHILVEFLFSPECDRSTVVCNLERRNASWSADKSWWTGKNKEADEVDRSCIAFKVTNDLAHSVPDYTSHSRSPLSIYRQLCGFCCQYPIRFTNSVPKVAIGHILLFGSGKVPNERNVWKPTPLISFERSFIGASSLSSAWNSVEEIVQEFQDVTIQSIFSLPTCKLVDILRTEYGIEILHVYKLITVIKMRH